MLFPLRIPQRYSVSSWLYCGGRPPGSTLPGRITPTYSSSLTRSWRSLVLSLSLMAWTKSSISRSIEEAPFWSRAAGAGLAASVARTPRVPRSTAAPRASTPSGSNLSNRIHRTSRNVGGFRPGGDTLPPARSWGFTGSLQLQADPRSREPRGSRRIEGADVVRRVEERIDRVTVGRQRVDERLRAVRYELVEIGLGIDQPAPVLHVDAGIRTLAGIPRVARGVDRRRHHGAARRDEAPPLLPGAVAGRGAARGPAVLDVSVVRAAGRVGAVVEEES